MSNSCHLHYEDKGDSQTAIVSFAGRKGMKGGIPTFEFSSIMSGIHAHKIYLRDPHKIWYQKGIPGIGNDIDEIAEWLDAFLNRCGARRTVFIGNSAGGYAALVLGALLSADRVHAFGPQTRLTDPKDSHTEDGIQKMMDDPETTKQYLNVKDLLKDYKPSTLPHINIYYAKHNSIDAIHAHRVEEIDNVRLYPFLYKDHGLIRDLKNLGALNLILRSGTWEVEYSRPVTYVLSLYANLMLPLLDKLRKVKRSIISFL